MALDSDNVRVALTGAVYVAPVGTTLPATISDTLDGAFADLGYLSDDGVEITPDAKTNETKAWQNDATVRRDLTRSWSMKFTAIESNTATVELYFGGTVTTVGGSSSLTVGAPDVDKRAFVVDCVDGDNLLRYVIPVGSLSDMDAISHKNADPIAYGMTVGIYEVDGVDFYRYSSALS